MNLDPTKRVTNSTAATASPNTACPRAAHDSARIHHLGVGHAEPANQTAQLAQRDAFALGHALSHQSRRLGRTCGAVAATLRDAYRANENAAAFFDFFATPPEGLLRPARVAC